jgi:hypothetical protein
LALAALAAATLWGALPMPSAAQWLHYPSRGVPRTASGEPRLDAPAPRAGDGKPDLSGIWVSSETLTTSCDEPQCIEQMLLPLDAIDIGRTRPGGLPYQPWAADLVRQRAADYAKDDPHARCLPPNFPRAYSFPQYKKIVQTPDLIVILHEFNATYRQIHLDGRPLPQDPHPGWSGYSTARWEGDTLVVSSNGFRDGLWLDLNGSPLTDAARVTERIKRLDYGNLEIEITVDDPKAYTAPWTVRLTQSIVLDTELLDQICLENEKSVAHMEGE